MRLLKLFCKWFLYITGGLLLLATLFLVVPGFECAWRSHADDPPLLALTRQKGGLFEVREIRVMEWHAALVFPSITIPSGAPRGAHLEGKIFYYIGDTWFFDAGENAKGTGMGFP